MTATQINDVIEKFIKELSVINFEMLRPLLPTWVPILLICQIYWGSQLKILLLI
jgi:hypothetical protein